MVVQFASNKCSLAHHRAVRNCAERPFGSRSIARTGRDMLQNWGRPAPFDRRHGPTMVVPARVGAVTPTRSSAPENASLRLSWGDSAGHPALPGPGNGIRGSPSPRRRPRAGPARLSSRTRAASEWSFRNRRTLPRNASTERFHGGIVRAGRFHGTLPRGIVRAERFHGTLPRGDCAGGTLPRNASTGGLCGRDASTGNFE